ncbi:hypothetical protein [Thalassotalea piscium]|uniref:Lipoprotein n=1 Tax=Thalassotalea piscium TaxID=1230533 RepID=A0A7X0TTZ7_9GAMM|nr:hypothetical protein [Thalassotalea piscium]MBB6543585.1 hypothetical protein [Thalassotalea piscium]
MNKLLTFVSSLILLAACTNKDLYNLGKDYQKSDCIDKAQNEAQYNECLLKEHKTYQEYKDARKKVINP